MTSPRPNQDIVHNNQSKWHNINRLKIRQLILLDALGDTLNLRLAAEGTHTTQPAASRMLKRLEETVGVELFERSQAGLKPNLAGELMIRYARKVLSDLVLAREEINQVANGLSGTINIGAVLSSASHILPKSIARLVTDFPRLQVSIQEGELHMLLDALRRGNLDLVLGRLNPMSDYQDLHYQVLSNEYFVIVAGCNHPLTSAKVLKAKDLVDSQWILPPRTTPIRNLIDNFFIKKIKRAPERVIASVSLATNQILINELECIGILPREAALAQQAAGTLKILPFDLGEIFGPLAIIRLSGEVTHRGNLALIAKIKEVVETSVPV